MIISENPKKNQSPPLSDTEKVNRADYRNWRDAVSQELQDRHHYDSAERWDYCDDSPRFRINRSKPDLPPSTTTVWVCSSSHECDAVLFSPTCDLRICPDCARRHSARLMNRYVPAIAEEMKKNPRYRLRTITLTRSVQLGDENFAESAKEGFELIQKMMRIVCSLNWNKQGRGLLANWEVGPSGNKLHYHMVYLGNWVDQKLMSSTWAKLTGGDKVVWVSAVKHNDGDWQGAVSETLKYATKFYSEDKETKKRLYLSASLTVDLFEAMKNTRRIRSWGSFYALEPEAERKFCCEECDGKMVRIGIGYYELWRVQNFSVDVWKLAIKKSLLNLRIADKSEDKAVKTENTPSKSQRLLPGMAEVRLKRTSHYDYE